MKMQMEAIVFQTMIKVENLWVLVKLLRECDAGIKMGIESIKQIIDYVKDCKLKEILHKSSDKHESLQDESTTLLHQYGDEGKEPNIMAKGMSWMKTNMKLTMDVLKEEEGLAKKLREYL